MLTLFLSKIRRLFIVLGISWLCMFGCTAEVGDFPRSELTYDPTNEIAENIELVFSDSARLRGTLTAPKMVNYTIGTDPREEFPEGLFITFYDETENLTSTLTAQWGVYRRRKDEFIVRDSVVWESIDQQRLQTEELIWNEKSRQIYTHKFVVLEQPGYLITGYGLQADQDFSNARVLRVDGRIPVSTPR